MDHRSSVSREAVLRIRDLLPGDHLCSFHADEEQRKEHLVPFIQAGREHKHKLLLIADIDPSEIEPESAYKEIAEVETNPQGLAMRHIVSREGFTRNGRFDPETMLELLRSESEQARRDGYDTLRVACDMSLVLADIQGSEPMFKHEADLEQFLTGSGIICLCQYDRRSFSSRILLDMLRTHPLVLLDSQIYENPYSLPPDKLLAEYSDTAELEHWIAHLIERRDKDERLRTSEARYRGLFESMESGVAVYEAVYEGKDFVVRDFNAAAERIEGLDRDEVIGRSVLQMFPAVEQFGLFGVLQRVWRTGDPEHLPEAVYRDERIDGWRDNYVYKLPTGEVVAVYEDVTKRKQAEEERNLSRRELEQIVEGTPLPLFVIDTGHTVTRWNRACELLTGIACRDIVGTKEPWRGFYTQERPVLADFIVDRASEEQVAASFRGRYWRSHVFEGAYMVEDFFPEIGDGVWLYFSAAPLYDEQGNTVGAVETLMDITQRKESEKAVRQNEVKYRQLFEEAAMGILIFDAERNIVDANTTALNVLGYGREEMCRLNASDLLHPDDLREVPSSSILATIATSDMATFERRYRTKNGDYMPVEVTAKQLQGEDSPGTYMVMFYDISKRKQTEERLHYLAYFDDLTGLPNQTLFRYRLHQAIVRSESTGLSGAVLQVDIDRLKSVNDTLGHQAGDRLLQEVARRITQVVRGSDTVARIAGDEFMVMSDNIGYAATAKHLGERLLRTINQEFVLREARIYPECSIGYTLFPDDAADTDTLFKQADIAMSEAKENKKEKVRGYAKQEDWISKQFYLEQDLKRALKNEEFVIYYQPQVELATEKVTGLEALIRWRHPEKGIISPAEFIPVLERTGLIVAVGSWIIRQVCSQLAFWKRKGGTPPRTAINISTQQLANEEFLTELDKALRMNGLETRYLGVELTETGLLQNVELSAKTLQELSDLGIQVALDDFGKGYSSLSYLQQLAIDLIKIDREFIAPLAESEQARILVKTIITMAHNLGKRALAEGVETREQLRILQELGCDDGQGFLWAYPRPMQELEIRDEGG